jgi:4-hydroxy-tetrahydrodipicolinate synthase
MKTDAVTPEDLVRSIMALPPIARSKDGRIAKSECRKIIDWLSSAGVTTFMYGGVANLFNGALSEYAAILDVIEEQMPLGAWAIPAVGPDFGKAFDQIAILRGRQFPTAILLPAAAVTSAGVATGLRRLSDALGKPLMVFFKSADYLTPGDAAALLADGVLCCVEFGVGAGPDAGTSYLSALLAQTGTAERIIDGAGERTIVGLSVYGIRGYTSGSGVIAPHLSMALLRAIRDGDMVKAEALRELFLPFEHLRQSHGPVPVLHDGVRFAGIADTGPIGPFFESITDPALVTRITIAAQALRAASAGYRA